MEIFLSRTLQAKNILKNYFKHLVGSAQLILQVFLNRLKTLGGSVIGGLEKGAEAARVASPPKHIIEGVDISKVANYVGYKAAMTKSKMNLEVFALGQFVVTVFIIFYCFSLSKQLRERVMLLVPSQINGVTEVTPNSLPASRVHKAFVNYLNLLGNFDATNIREHYNMLKDHMSRDLKIKFSSEMSPTIEHVLEEGLSEYIKIGDKKVEPDGKGWYRAIAPVTVYPTLRGVASRPRHEYIVMKLRIVAPKDQNTWGLEITELKRVSAGNFIKRKRK